jgi:hypothetical protein
MARTHISVKVPISVRGVLCWTCPFWLSYTVKLSSTHHLLTQTVPTSVHSAQRPPYRLSTVRSSMNRSNSFMEAQAAGAGSALEPRLIRPNQEWAMDGLHRGLTSWPLR